MSFSVQSSSDCEASGTFLRFSEDSDLIGGGGGGGKRLKCDAKQAALIKDLMAAV